MSSPVLTVLTVSELNISKQKMLFPKIFISVQEAKESDVRKYSERMIYFLLGKGYVFNHFSVC